MSRFKGKSVLGLLLAVAFSLGATQPGGCTGATEPEPQALQGERLETTSGAIFITCHDPDFHAQGENGAQRLLTKALAYVRDGNTLPFLWVESRISPPGGHRVGKAGLLTIGLVEGRDFIHLDGAQLAAQPATWWGSLTTHFSAIAVASDFGGILTQTELDQLNAHREDIARFVNAGRGLFAAAEGGQNARLTQRDWFKFLPIDVGSTATAAPPYVVTAYGASEFGLINQDVDSPSHCHFADDFGLNVVSRSAPTGQIMTLAGKVRITGGGFLVANAGPDQELDARAAGTPVRLDGSGSSTDPDGAPLRYRWTEGDTVLAETDSATVVVVLSRPGVHTVTLTVTNRRGESASDEVVITLRNVPPRITCPADLVRPTDPGVCRAAVTWPAPGVEATAGVASVTCTPASGSAFPTGTTPVTCTVVDLRGFSASCGFHVTVRDEEPPVVVPPAPATVSADGACRAHVPYVFPGAQLGDNCTPRDELVLSQSPVSGTAVGLGTHPITLRVTDEAGNRATAATSLTVIDTTPPVISGAAADPSVLWPPNHKLVPVSVSTQVADNCDAAVQCRIDGVTSNEPINGPGDGNTAPDWELSGPLAVSLRAERAGPLSGRVYTLGLVCTDAAGLEDTTSVDVTVPHDQRGR